MSVAAITAQYVNVLDRPPLDVPLPVRNGTVKFLESEPWSRWLNSVQIAARAISVRATVDFGTIAAQSFASVLIPFSTALELRPTDYVADVVHPTTAGGLLFKADIVLLNEIKLYCINPFAAGATPGDLDIDCLIIPRRA